METFHLFISLENSLEFFQSGLLISSIINVNMLTSELSRQTNKLTDQVEKSCW